jgi:ribonuclease P protein component
VPKAVKDSPYKFSFSSKNKLLKKAEFQFVFTKSRKSTHRYLLALYRHNKGKDARLGIIIGKRWVKAAVHRNLLRRIIRESFRHQKEDLKGLDIILLICSECTPLREPFSKKTVRDDIDYIWRTLMN